MKADAPLPRLGIERTYEGRAKVAPYEVDVTAVPELTATDTPPAED